MREVNEYEVGDVLEYENGSFVVLSIKDGKLKLGSAKEHVIVRPGSRVIKMGRKLE